MTLRIPTYSQDTANITEVLDKLEKLITLIRTQIQAIVVNLIQNSGLDHLLLSLNTEELTEFKKFRQAMINRYSHSNEAMQSYLINQTLGEHELDILSRIKRVWLRMKGENSFLKRISNKKYTDKPV